MNHRLQVMKSVLPLGETGTYPKSLENSLASSWCLNLNYTFTSGSFGMPVAIGIVQI